MSLYETIGANQPQYLLADPNGSETIAISVEPNNGIVQRGTVMYRKPSGMYAPAEAANATSSNYLVVINESVDTGANTTIGEVAAAYRTGRLIAQKVLISNGTAVAGAVVLALRQQGIQLDYMDDWELEEKVFNNTTTP